MVRSKLFVIWFGVSLIAGIVYWPGLYGPFLLDDFANLNWLGAYGEINSWERFVRFYHSFGGGPLGRPVSRLTFLLNSNNWPADPFYFKFTNLLIHIANGTILCVVNYLLIARFCDFQKRAVYVLAIASAGLWLFHPFLISTVLYPVQRMAQLSAFFSLLGLLYYLAIRPGLECCSYLKGILYGVGLGFFTLMAVLSKENGILLPVFAGVIEICFFCTRKYQYNRKSKVWILCFILTPSVIVFAYLLKILFEIPFFTFQYSRDFSLYERLLTQSRVLLDYLSHWFVPQLYTAGVFHDGFPKSTGLTAPITTLYSIVLLGLLIVFAMVGVKRRPLVFIAVLFFFMAHLLESSVVMLELYFEHRNYLPSAFLMLPVVVALYRVVSIKLFYVLIAAVLSVLIFLTSYGARVWSNYDSIVEASYIKAPYSSRAKQQYSMVLLNRGESEKAYKVIKAAKSQIEGDTSLRVWSLIVSCKSGYGDVESVKGDMSYLSDSSFNVRNLIFHELLIDSVRKNTCPYITLVDLGQLYGAMLKNGHHNNSNSISYSHLNYLYGLTMLYLGEIVEAERLFNLSLDARGAPEKIMKIAALLATSGYYEQANKYANRAVTACCSSDNNKNSEFYSDILSFKKQVKKQLELEGESDRL